MKKSMVLIAILVILMTCCTAYADIHDKSILFRGIEWGSTVSEAAKGLPNGVMMRDTQTKEYWYFMADCMFDDNNGDYYKAELGCYEYARSNSLENVKVAGYNVADLYLYYVYTTGEDGLLVKDNAHTSLIYAYYKLEPKDPDGVYADLIAKLTSLYGDVDEHQQKSPYIVYEQNLWYGADGTMVSLVKEDYPSGSHYIYIKYGYSGADLLLEDAYDAVVREEILNAASNTDGL